MSFDLEDALGKLRQEFLEGSVDRLDQIDDCLNRIFQDEGSRGENFFQMQRDIHSLKGTAGTYGFTTVSTIAHRLEDYMEGSRRLDQPGLQDVQKFIDIIRRVLETGIEPNEAERDAILAELPSVTKQGKTAAEISDQSVKEIIVLMVMDKGLQRKMIGTELVSCGFSVSFSESPVEAIGLALRVKPQVILSNLEFDEMSGIELANVFKEIKATEDIPFVLMTSRKGKIPNLPSHIYVCHKSGDFAEELTETLIDLGLFGELNAKAGTG